MSNNALFRKSQTHAVNVSIYNFDCIFLEIPVKNCIVGMLWTCPIPASTDMDWTDSELLTMEDEISAEVGGGRCWLSPDLLLLLLELRDQVWPASEVTQHYIICTTSTLVKTWLMKFLMMLFLVTVWCRLPSCYYIQHQPIPSIAWKAASQSVFSLVAE